MSIRNQVISALSSHGQANTYVIKDYLSSHVLEETPTLGQIHRACLDLCANGTLIRVTRKRGFERKFDLSAATQRAVWEGQL